MSVLLSRDECKMALFCRCVCGDGILKAKKRMNMLLFPILEKLKKSKKGP